ncbi:MAG: phosphotransferase, partial [Acidimicrobiia bacterium]|nr:phosphotransferase [Acidimicrobiia bacterium]
MTDDAVDAPGLESWLAASLGWAGPRISNQRPLQAGWESDVIAFDVVHASGEHHLVVRLYEGQDAAAKAVREFDGMRELANAGFPVPFVFGAEPDGAVLGRPFLVMEFVAGNAEWTWPEAAASSHFSRLFNELHSLDWRPFAAKLGQGGVEETLEDFRGYLVNAPIPGFEKWLRWLDERLHSVPRLE